MWALLDLVFLLVEDLGLDFLLHAFIDLELDLLLLVVSLWTVLVEVEPADQDCSLR